MSVLQKLFNFMHSAPRASHFKVRDLNVYFKESVAPTYKLISLDNIESLELQVEEEDKEYNLVAYIKRQGKETDIILGTFETKKEAEAALHKVKNRLFGGGKTLLSIANGFVLILVYTSLIVGFLHSFKNDPTGMPNLPAGLPNISLNGGGDGNVNMADMSKLQKQLLQKALQQAAQQGVTGVGSAPGLPNSGALMNNIVSSAIQQAQGQAPVAGEPAPTNVPQATSTPSTVQAVEKPDTAGDDLLKQMK